MYNGESCITHALQMVSPCLVLSKLMLTNNLFVTCTDIISLEMNGFFFAYITDIYVLFQPECSDF